MPALRELARRSLARRRDHEPAEAVFVAAPRELRAVGRPRVRALTRTPRRLRVLALLREHRTRVRAVGIGDPQRGPPVGVGDERELRTVGREPRLTRGNAVAADRLHRSSPSASPSRPRRAAITITRRVPRHVGEIPLVPREQRTVGRPRGIPRVVGVRDAHRPRRTVERHDRDVARVVALDRARDLTARRHRGRDRVAVAGAGPARVAVGEHDRDEAAVAGDHHHLVVGRPAPAAAEPACRRSRPPAASSRRSRPRRGRSDRRSCRSRRAGRRPATTGDRPPRATGRPSPPVIRAVTRRTLALRQPAAATPRPAWVLGGGLQPGSPPSILVTTCLIVRSPCRAPATPSASPSSSTEATRTAGARASTAAT